MLIPPLPDGEVVAVAASAWKKEMAGQNWFGRAGRVVVSNDEVDKLPPDALILLMRLRRKHWGDATFTAPNELAIEIGWSRKRLAGAREHLLSVGELIELRPASSFHGAAIYRFKGGRK